MRQYLEQKAAVPDAILLFRIGDFYETFYDDAKLIARELGLTLTARNKGDANPIPLAGVPHHAVDGYVARLVRAGYKVALSEQMEDPRQARGVVRREIVRIITPGTLTDETLLEDRCDNWLAAVCRAPTGRRSRGRSDPSGDKMPPAHGGTETLGLAWVELASGRFFARRLPAAAVLDELARIGPAEVVVAEASIDRLDPLVESIRAAGGTTVTTRPAHQFDEPNARRALQEQFGVTTVEGLGFDEFDDSLRAAGAIVQYLRDTQRSALGHLLRIEPRDERAALHLDLVTLRSLEIERTIRDGGRAGSLLGAVDRTSNPMGARRLREWLCFPLRDAAGIRARHDAVGDLRADRGRLGRLRRLLRESADVERITARLGVGRAGPRDLVGLRETLGRLDALRRLICKESRIEGLGIPAADESHDAAPLGAAAPPLLHDLAAATAGLDELHDLLARAMRADAPPTLRDGGCIADGFDAELDRLRALRTHGDRWLAEFQAREAARSGIPSLKVGYNSVFGYYIEITHAHRARVPPDYVRRQTVRNAERYICDELKRHEEEALSAQTRALAREAELFEHVRAAAAAQIAALRRAADALAQIDVLAGLAELALERGYCRPEILDPPDPAERRGAPHVLEIEDGRHPVLEQTLAERFVPNDCTLSTDGPRLLVITGPNMAGKSTYIRQTALLLLLAQAGSWVPARTCRLTPADRLCARVGASDELARGQSTFMVEMVETARILNRASRASLVILDEIGRGTSTFDGLALARAIAEHLAARIGCRALFATHYHELTDLAESRRGVANYNVAVREQRRPDGAEEVVFLHRIVPGGSDRSYGIHVARMAGIPPSVVARGREVLAELECAAAARPRGGPDAASVSQSVLFPPAPPPPAWWEALADELARLDLDRMTPLDALAVLSDVQARIRSESGRA